MYTRVADDEGNPTLTCTRGTSVAADIIAVTAIDISLVHLVEPPFDAIAIVPACIYLVWGGGSAVVRSEQIMQRNYVTKMRGGSINIHKYIRYSRTYQVL